MMANVFKRKRKIKGRIITARTYTGRYRFDGEPGYTTVRLGVADKQVAQQKLHAIMQREERERAGLAVSQVDQECLNAPLLDLLENYIGELERLGRTDEYTRHIRARVTALGEECGWSRLRDVSADGFRVWRNAKSASVKTINEYQNAIAALLRWIGKAKGVKLPVFEAVEHIDARGRQSFERRALTVEEARKLLEVAPIKRRVTYALALYTGLRRGEICSLKWSDLTLDAASPVVSIRAAISKNRKLAFIPLHADLVQVLCQWRDEGTDGSGLVVPDGIPENEFGLWRDMKAAGISRIDASERRVDFHALRHTTCTFLQAAGVSPRVAMEIMRHSEMRLTAKVYTDVGGLPTVEGISKMPSLIDGKKWTRNLTLSSGFEGQSGSRAVNPGESVKDVQPVDLQGVDNKSQAEVPCGKKGDLVLEGGLEPPRYCYH
jgi:integrase